MNRKSFYILIEIMIGVTIYYILSSYIQNRALLILLILVVGVVFVIIRYFFGLNEADVLEMTVDPEKFFESIKNLETRDKNRFYTLKMYGLTYTGDYDEAELLLSQIVYDDIRTSRNLHYDYYVSKLHLLYNNKEIDTYQDVYNEALERRVFDRVDVKNESFGVHLLILAGEYEKAIEVLKEIIPFTRTDSIH